MYKDDLDDCFGDELVQFVDFVETFKDEQENFMNREFHVSADTMS